MKTTTDGGVAKKKHRLRKSFIADLLGKTALEVGSILAGPASAAGNALSLSLMYGAKSSRDDVPNLDALVAGVCRGRTLQATKMNVAWWLAGIGANAQAGLVFMNALAPQVVSQTAEGRGAFAGRNKQRTDAVERRLKWAGAGAEIHSRQIQRGLRPMTDQDLALKIAQKVGGNPRTIASALPKLGLGRSARKRAWEDAVKTRRSKSVPKKRSQI